MWIRFVASGARWSRAKVPLENGSLDACIWKIQRSFVLLAGEDISLCKAGLDMQWHQTSFPAKLTSRAETYSRDKAAPRLVWGDAICINQDDKEERGPAGQACGRNL